MTLRPTAIVAAAVQAVAVAALLHHHEVRHVVHAVARAEDLARKKPPGEGWPEPCRLARRFD
jgi:hypothetical protein